MQIDEEFHHFLLTSGWEVDGMGWDGKEMDGVNNIKYNYCARKHQHLALKLY